MSNFDRSSTYQDAPRPGYSRSDPQSVWDSLRVPAQINWFYPRLEEVSASGKEHPLLDSFAPEHHLSFQSRRSSVASIRTVNELSFLPVQERSFEMSLFQTNVSPVLAPQPSEQSSVFISVPEEMSADHEMSLTAAFTPDMVTLKLPVATFYPETETTQFRQKSTVTIKGSEKSMDVWRTPKTIKKDKKPDTRIHVKIGAVPVSTVSPVASPQRLAKSEAVSAEAKGSVPQSASMPEITVRSAETPTDTAEDEKVFKCLHCPKTYVNARALGGHASKMHAGMSKTYNNKLKVREARVSERNARNIAKHLFKYYSSSPTDAKSQRLIVTKVKKVILDSRPESILQTDAEDLPDSWYAVLAQELRDGRHGKAIVYLEYLDLKTAKARQSS